MALDYQKTVYLPPREPTRRTSYGQMNQWNDLVDGTSASWDLVEQQRKFRPYRHIPPITTCSIDMPSESHLAITTARHTKQRQMMGNVPVHLQYNKSGGYDDFHKAYLKIQNNQDGLGLSPRSPNYPTYGPPRLRNGRVGGSWRHVKNVLQAKGSRTVFVDGVPRMVDNSKLMSGEVPAGNALQPSMSLPTPPPSRSMQSVKPSMGMYALEAHQGTQKGNWAIMR